jgi:glutamyl-tRNA synthetase
MTPLGRYAPTPSGRLHRGNLRTALLAHGQMDALGGRMVLRLDDLDTPRVHPQAEEWILRDLEALELNYVGGVVRQSDRVDHYWEALTELARRGLVYACRCSRRDLREASAPHGPEGYVYPGTCRPPEPVAVTEEELRQPDTAWRLRTDVLGEIEFLDSYVGRVRQHPADGGDFVVRRRDGLWAYQLASAVDDWEMGISHVLRGQDLIQSTVRQLAVLAALGRQGPSHWCHVPLVCDRNGVKLSKRDGSEGLPREAWEVRGCGDVWRRWVFSGFIG